MSSGTTNYAYDGDNIVEELSSTGTSVARYAQSLGIDEPLAMYRSGVGYAYHADGLGSIGGLTDANGNIAATYTYDSFGNLTGSTGTVTNPYRYTAREFDTETGIYYYRARYYFQGIGRFASEDPAGFVVVGNFYTYVLNRPTQLTDPMGLSAQDVQRIQAACKKCTKQLTDQGLRYNGSGTLWGWWNDFTTWTTEREGCWNQALRVQPCLESPTVPYDGNWTFNVVPVGWGFHHVVEATDSNPNDPNVFCDPWRNTSWTAPKTPTGPAGGGGGW